MVPRSALRLALLLAAPMLTTLAAGGAHAQYTASPDLARQTPVKLSAHVYEIEGFPNVGIIVGSQAVLVVDTGLGQRNGAAVAAAARALSPPGAKLYLTTTHFHSEHASGEAAFPAGTVLIRSRAQEEERLASGEDTLKRFRANPTYASWMDGAAFRKPDMTFDNDYRLDLGGVHVRLVAAGGGHTAGDQLVFVEEDRLAMTGDVVQNKVSPAATALAGTSPRRWLAALDTVEALHARIILPDHSPPAGPELIGQYRAFLQQLDARARALKAEGVPVKDAAATITAEIKASHPDWMVRDQIEAVTHAYAEAP
jgi:glyoxylase-like metal-dependent hydrolase (beta-lactamase superfamily II)